MLKIIEFRLVRVNLLLLAGISLSAEAAGWHMFAAPGRLHHPTEPINIQTGVGDVAALSPQRELQYVLTANDVLGSLLKAAITSAPPQYDVILNSHSDTPPSDTTAKTEINAQITNVQVLYLHTDLLGSVIAETDLSGNTIKTTTYKPFGESKSN